jgi:hypothetical protein
MTVVTGEWVQKVVLYCIGPRTAASVRLSCLLSCPVLCTGTSIVPVDPFCLHASKRLILVMACRYRYRTANPNVGWRANKPSSSPSSSTVHSTAR